VSQIINKYKTNYINLPMFKFDVNKEKKKYIYIERVKKTI